MNILVKKLDWDSNKLELIKMRNLILQEEQGFTTHLIHDGLDDESIHIGAFQSIKIVASCRLSHIDNSTFKLGRMVVEKDFRLKGLGAALMEYIFNEILPSYPEKNVIQMEAQKQASGFYKKHKCSIVSSEYVICGIPHYKMEWRKVL